MLKANSSPIISYRRPPASDGDAVRSVRHASAPGTWQEAVRSAEGSAALRNAQLNAEPINPHVVQTTGIAASTPAPRNPETLVRILKARRLTVHGLHLRLGIPGILALASAYATDKITRKVFFDTLDLLVRHIDARYDQQRIRPEELIALGIPEADAKILPLVRSYLDIWLFAGLFNGVTDMVDLGLLRNPERKGEFIKRHFGVTADGKFDIVNDYPFLDWNPYTVLIDTDYTYRTEQFQSQIQPACASLEGELLAYSAVVHYTLRLAAASLSGRTLEVLGPFERINDLHETFNDIFHVVDPDFAPPFGYQWSSFTFKEPAVPPPKFRQRVGGPLGITAARPEEEEMRNVPSTEREDLMRAITNSVGEVLRQAGIDEDVEIPESKLAAVVDGLIAAGDASHRTPKKSRPPSCVIV